MFTGRYRKYFWLPSPPQAETADKMVNPPAADSPTELLLQNLCFYPFSSLATFQKSLPFHRFRSRGVFFRINEVPYPFLFMSIPLGSGFFRCCGVQGVWSDPRFGLCRVCRKYGFEGYKPNMAFQVHLKKGPIGGDWTFLFFGSPARTRTADKMVNSHLLYQLSYWGSGSFCFLVLYFTPIFNPMVNPPQADSTTELLGIWFFLLSGTLFHPDFNPMVNPPQADSPTELLGICFFLLSGTLFHPDFQPDG